MDEMEFSPHRPINMQFSVVVCDTLSNFLPLVFVCIHNRCLCYIYIWYGFLTIPKKLFTSEPVSCHVIMRARFVPIRVD